MEKIGIEISADGSVAIREAARVEQAMGGIGAGAERIERSSQTAMAALSGVAQAAATAFSIREMSQAVDAWQNLNAQMRLATGSAKGGAEAYGAVLDIATSTGQSLEQVGNVYKRFAENAAQLGMSQQMVGDTSRTVAQAIALSGGSAASAEAALTQFGQALASGALRGEELNSILEQAPRLARVLADGLGVPIGQLRTLAQEGELTGDAIVKALGSQSAKVAKEFGELPVTMGRALQNLQTAWIDTVGSFERSSGVFGRLAGAVDGAARNMDVLAVAGTAVAAVYGGRMVAAIGAAAAAKAADAIATARQAAATEAAAVASARYSGLMLSQSAATAAATAATTASTVASAGAATLARGALAALGGPIGLVTTALTLGAMAWVTWGDKTKEATSEAAKSAIQELDSIISKIQEMNSRLDQTSRRSYDGVMSGAESNLKTTRAQIDLLQGKLDALDAGGGRGRFNDEGKALQAQLNVLASQEIDLQNQLGEARRRSAEVGTAALQKFTEANATGAEKLGQQRQKLVSEFSAAIAQAGGEFDAANASHAGALRALNSALAELGKKGVDKSAMADSAQAIKAEIAGIVDAAKDGASAQVEAIKAQHAEGLLSWNEYFAQTAAAQEAAARKEVEAYGRGLDNAMRKGDKGEIQDFANKLAAAGMKIQRVWQDAAAGMSKVQHELRTEMLDTLEQETQALEQKSKQMGVEAAQYGMTTAQIYEAAAARVQERIEMDGYGEDSAVIVEALQRQKKAYESMASAARAADGRKAADQAAKDAAEAWKRTGQEIERSITDALMRGFESGKGFGENLRDAMVNMFKTLVLRPVVQFGVQGALSAVGLGALSGSAQAASPGSLLSTGSSALSAGSNLYSVAGGAGGFFSGMASVGSEAALGAAFVGPSASLAGGTVGAGAQIGSIFGSAASGIAAALPYVGAALAVASLLGAFKDGGGPKVEGNAYGTLDAAGLLAIQHNASFAAPYGDGDWGRPGADAARVGEMLKPVGESIAAYIKGLGGSAAGLGVALGYNADPQGDAPDGVMGAVYDKSGAEIYRRVYEVERGKAGEAMQVELQRLMLAAVQAAEGIEPIFSEIADGVDLATASAEQLSAALADLQKVSALREAFEAIDLSAGNVTTALLKAAGGIDALAASAASYYQGYFSEDERTQKLQESLAEQFAALGLVMPATREEFRALVEQVGATGDAGAATVARLLGLSEAFGTVADAASAGAQKAVEAARQSVAAAESGLRAAYQRQAGELERTASQFADFARSLRALREGLLVGEFSPLSVADRDAEATRQFEQVAARAKLGDVAAIEELRAVSEQYLAVGQDSASSAEDYYRRFARVQEVLKSTEGVAQRHADIAQDSLGALTAQVSSLIEINQSVLSVEAAIQALGLARSGAGAAGGGGAAGGAAAPAGSAQAAMLDYAAKAGGDAYYFLPGINDYTAKLKTVSGWAERTGHSIADAFETITGKTQAYWLEIQRQFDAGLAPTTATIVQAAASGSAAGGAAASGAGNDVAAAFREVLGRAPQAAGLEYWASSGLTGDALRREIAAAAREEDKLAASAYLRVNGSHFGGLARVPYDGYFAELHQDEAVVDADSVAAIQRYFHATPATGGNTELIAEVRALRAEVVSLRAAGEATARNTHGTRKLLEQFDGDGLPQTRAA